MLARLLNRLMVSTQVGSVKGHIICGDTQRPARFAEVILVRKPEAANRTGASGTLGQAFARVCAERQLACRIASRGEMDIADPASVAAAIGWTASGG